MATTEDNKKKPLVKLDAANPADAGQQVQDFAKPDSQVGVGWGQQSPGDGEWSQWQKEGAELYGKDDTPTLSASQVREFRDKGTISGVDQSNPNNGPGGAQMNVQLQSPVRGVYRGRPEVMEYDKILRAMKPIETEEERKAREKKERRDALFSAIGDGVSALSNLYFTTKGSPSADQSKTLTKAQQELVDKQRKEREANMSKRLSLLKQQREAELALRQQDLKEDQAAALTAYRQSLVKMHDNRLEDNRRYRTWQQQYKEDQAQRDAEHKKEIERLQQENLELKQREQDRKDKQTDYNTGKPYYNPNTGHGKSGGSSGDSSSSHHHGGRHGGKKKSSSSHSTRRSGGRGTQRRTTSRPAQRPAARPAQSRPRSGLASFSIHN